MPIPLRDLAALPSIPSPLCSGPIPFNPVCATKGAGSTIANAGAGAILSAIAHWVTDGSQWLMGQIAHVLVETTSIDLSSSWFLSHFRIMVSIAGVAVLPLIMGSIVQALLRQDAGILIRSALIHLPLAMLLTGAAVQVTRLALATTDSLSTTVSTDTGGDIGRALGSIARLLAASAGDSGLPTFVLLLGGLLVGMGAFLLWIELLVRSAAVYVAVLFLPIALAGLVWPAISHWSRRLAETLAALILSKFVIVAILSLAAAAVTSEISPQPSQGNGIAAVFGGGALLILATLSPFTLLRLIPIFESSAATHLEAVRHRLQQVVSGVPASAASYALRQIRGATVGLQMAGTGEIGQFAPPGGDVRDDGETRGGGGSPMGGPRGMQSTESPDQQSDEEGGERDGISRASESDVDGIPMWRGDAPSSDAYLNVLAQASRAPEESQDGPLSKPPINGRASHHAAVRGTHVLARDSMGPVIRWVRETGDVNEGRNGF